MINPVTTKPMRNESWRAESDKKNDRNMMKLGLSSTFLHSEGRGILKHKSTNLNGPSSSSLHLEGRGNLMNDKPAGPRRHASGSHLHTRSMPNLGTIKGLVNMNIKAQAAQQELRRASELPSMPGFVEEKHNKTNKGNEHVAKLWTKAKKIRSQVSGPESTADSATPFATVATAPAVPRPVKNTENGAGDTVNLSPVQIEGSGPDACIDPEASITVMHASDYQACAAPRSTPPGADIQFSSRKMHLPPLPISHDQSASPSPRSTLVDSPRRW